MSQVQLTESIPRLADARATRTRSRTSWLPRLRRRRHVLLPLDVIVQFGAWFAAMTVMEPQRNAEQVAAIAGGLAVVVVGVWWVGGHYGHLFARERTQSMMRLGKALSTSGIVATLGAVTFGLSAGELVVGVVASAVTIVLVRSFLGALVRVARGTGRSCSQVLVVGLNDESKELLELIGLNPDLGLDVVAMVGNPAQALCHGFELGDRYLGPVQVAAREVRARHITTVLVVTSALSPAERSLVLGLLRECDVDIHVTAGLTTVDQRHLDPQPIAYTPMFSVPSTSRRRTRTQLGIKRLVDVVAAGGGLVVFSPLIVIGCVLVRVSGRGPVFYRQTRLGLNGRSIELLRLRTMVVEPSTGSSNVSSPLHLFRDPRMTAVGRVLEMLSINELPMLWNVLRGDISLVGPQPGYPAFDLGQPVLTMRPGFTGFWRTEANLYPSRVVRRQVDALYTTNWSLMLDVAIALSSIELVFTRLLRGAGWRHATRPDAGLSPAGQPHQGLAGPVIASVN